MLRFNFQTVAFDVDDPNTLANSGRTAAGRPFAIADAHSATVRIYRLYDNDDASKQSTHTVVEQRIRCVIVAGCIEAAAAYTHCDECQGSKEGELQRERKPQSERQ